LLLGGASYLVAPRLFPPPAAAPIAAPGKAVHP
jgi:hypothetical protein